MTSSAPDHLNRIRLQALPLQSLDTPERKMVRSPPHIPGFVYSSADQEEICRVVQLVLRSCHPQHTHFKGILRQTSAAPDLQTERPKHLQHRSRAPGAQIPFSSIRKELGPHAPDASCTPTRAAARTEIHPRSTLLLRTAMLRQTYQLKNISTSELAFITKTVCSEWES